MQQFTIQSEAIRDKLNALLPAQNLGAIGVELTGSTQIIPIVDLTEVAEGSNIRQDLQTALSFKTATAFDVNNATTTVINTTGYWRVTGGATGGYHGSTNEEIASIIINDGTSDKTVWAIQVRSDQVYLGFDQNVDYTVFLPAGHSLKILSSSTAVRFIGSIRQIADLSGNLIDP
jgi:hypothetical protein